MPYDRVHVLNTAEDYAQSIVTGRAGGGKVYYQKVFGTNTDVATSGEDLWNGGNLYTGQPASGSPELVTVSSDNANDTSAGTGARTIRLWGLKTSSSTAYEYEDVTLNGATLVDSASTWWRVNKAWVLTAGSGGENAGTIAIAHKTTTANIMATMPATYNETQICAWTVPANSTAYLRRVRVALSRPAGLAGSGFVSIRSRESGGVYRARPIFSVTNSGPVQYTNVAAEVFAAGTDIKVRADSVSANSSIVECALEFLVEQS